MTGCVAEATIGARRAFEIAARSTAEKRSSWLLALADALDATSEELVSIAREETHLSPERLAGEVMRTSTQLRMFASAIIDGSHLEITIDDVAPGGTALPQPMRRMLIPLGPVAVFAASNFPFAFSVLGGDTASALAVGCSVVVKAHPGHPRLADRVMEIAAAALDRAGAPIGLLGLVSGVEEGRELVLDPRIEAVGFTGSTSGGRALFDLAQGRPKPIPFYGELGSVNPVVITPTALAERRSEIVSGLVGSFTLGSGQFCTKPGIVFIPRDSSVGADIAATLPPALAPLLNDHVLQGYAAGLDRLVASDAVEVLAAGSSDGTSPSLLRTTAADLMRIDALREECFGPVTLLVDYGEAEELENALRSIGGSLTLTVHRGAAEDCAAIVDIGNETAGRVIFDGWPTGVAVTWSQQHGGPWPATTNPLHTSVGVTAMRRFQRPIVFQGARDADLPPALQDGNPLGLVRRVDGRIVA